MGFNSAFKGLSFNSYVICQQTSELSSETQYVRPSKIRKILYILTMSFELRCCVAESSASVLGVSAADGCLVFPCSQVTQCAKQNGHTVSLRCSVNLEYWDYILSIFFVLFYALGPLEGGSLSTDVSFCWQDCVLVVRL